MATVTVIPRSGRTLAQCEWQRAINASDKGLIVKSELAIFMLTLAACIPVSETSNVLAPDLPTNAELNEYVHRRWYGWDLRFLRAAGLDESRKVEFLRVSKTACHYRYRVMECGFSVIGRVSQGKTLEQTMVGYFDRDANGHLIEVILGN